MILFSKILKADRRTLKKNNDFIEKLLNENNSLKSQLNILEA